MKYPAGLNYKKLNNPLVAAQWPIRGLFLLTKPGMRRFVWGPIVINLVIYSIGFWISARYFSLILGRIIPSWLDWLEWLIWPLFFLTLILITFVSFTLLANIIAAPFYGKLAVKIQEHLSGEPVVVKKQQSPLKEILSAMGSEISRIGYFVTRAIPILILFVIPVVNLIAPILWICLSAWFLTMEYASYSLDEQGIPFSEQKRKLKKFRLGAAAFGGITMIGLAIPVLNIFIPPSAVAGATAYIASGNDNDP